MIVQWEVVQVIFILTIIIITDIEGKKLKVYSLSSNSENYGLLNIIQWKIRGTKNDTRYRVKIENVVG